MENIIIRGAPNQYQCKEGVLDELEEKLVHSGIKRILIVTGENSWEAASPYFPALNEVDASIEFYNGECSPEEITRIAKLATDLDVDAIVAVGGGKVIDIVKASSNESRKKSVIIPTLASNCAPWTPLSVIYTEEGVMTHYDIYPTGIELLLIEPRIIIEAPLNLFVAGIGDTLAKWYEADVQIGQLEEKSVPVDIAYFAAKQCKEVLLTHSERAIEAVHAETANPSFIKVVEAVIVLGGMVGGYGDSYGRIAGAHSIHNGMTVLEETHTKLHGDKVAYGILVQLLLEEKLGEMKTVADFYEKLGLPTSLVDLGIENVTEEVAFQIAEKATQTGESIHVMRKEGISASEVAKAILTLEKQHIL